MNTAVMPGRRMMCRFAVLGAALVASLPAWSANVVVRSAAELEAAAAAARPGDNVIIADGRYADFRARINAVGAEGRPVTVRAQTPGKAVFTGQSSLSIEGQWSVLSGVVFTDGNPPAPPIARDTNTGAIDIRGSNNRVTEVAIIDYSKDYKAPEGVPAAQATHHKWIGLHGQRNRVDHSLFQGKKGGGTLMVVWRPNAEPNHHRIDHNAFIDVEWGKDQNGWETIRVGDSRQSQSDSFTVVENNYFERCDGETEIISNKSGGNIFRGNTFRNSRGALTLRHGKGNTVENNVFFGGGLVPTGGIRVTDRDQVIRNNYIEGVRGLGDGIGGLALLAHSLNPPLNDYWPIENLVVENNSIINTSGSVLIGGGRSRQNPVSATFRNNVICTNLDGNSDFSLFTTLNKAGESKISLTDNVLCAKSMGTPPAPLDGNVQSAAGIEQVNGMWIAKDATKGYRPTGKVITRADTGPQTFKP